MKTAPSAAPAAPEGGPPEAQPSAAPPAAAVATSAEQPVDGIVKTEEKPAADAADAALDQKMAQEDKPRLIQARATRNWHVCDTDWQQLHSKPLWNRLVWCILECEN